MSRHATVQADLNEAPAHRRGEATQPGPTPTIIRTLLDWAGAGAPGQVNPVCVEPGGRARRFAREFDCRGFELAHEHRSVDE